MDILYVCSDRGISVLGEKGASVHLRELSRALAALGHRVVLAAAVTSGPAQAPLGVDLQLLPADPLETGRVLVALAAQAQVVLERYSLGSGPARVAARSAGVPFAFEVNAPLVAEAARYRGLTNIPAWHDWENRTWAGADLAFAVSSPLAAEITARCPGTPVSLLRNGFSLASAPARDIARAQYGLRPEQIAFVFTGAMKPWHGVLELTDAFAGLSRSVPARLLLAGHGPLTTALTERAAADPDRVTVLGALDRDGIAALLAAADAGVAPYLPVPGFYFSPLKVLEYLGAGLPVIYSNEGDIQQIVGPAGLPVPAGNITALTDAIRLLATEPTKRSVLAAAARPQVQNASWEAVAGRLVAQLSTLRNQK